MRRKQSGFALLLVFLMSATIAIMLYVQLPRAAFEAQRMKEEMLIERGEEYVRAIQLYTSRWKSYPASMDALEGTNGIRFLRHRYRDPMTGKDEWRLLHIDAAGMLTDSKVKKKEEKKPSENKFISEAVGIGQEAVSTGPAGVNIGLRKRDSDGKPEALPMDGTLPGQPPPAGGAQVPPTQPGQPVAPGQQPQMPPGVPPPPPTQGNPMYPTTPATQQGGSPAQPGNAALNMINNILTNPSQNPPAGMQVPGVPGMAIGGGIAGVASTLEQGSIKVYNERQRYDEWEFTYDIKKDKRLKQQLNQMTNMGTAPTGLTPQTGTTPQPVIPQQPGMPPQPFGQPPSPKP